jgi:hypothetical protein
MDHFYESIGENWFSYANFYKDIVSKLPNNAQVIEVGCWKGRSTCCLGVEIINSRKNIILHCVDSWKYTPSTEQPISTQEEFDQVFYEFLSNVKPFNDFINILKRSSTEASNNFLSQTVDFICIDANHTYESVKEDILVWLPKLKKNGILAGHDYFTSVHPGVKKAVDEIFNNTVRFIPEQNIWYFIK